MIPFWRGIYKWAIIVKRSKNYNKPFEAQSVHAQLTQDEPSNPNDEE